MSGTWLVYGLVVAVVAFVGLANVIFGWDLSKRERRIWARCVWLAPIWPGVVGWFVSKWLGMFVAFMWRTAWSKGGRDV